MVFKSTLRPGRCVVLVAIIALTACATTSDVSTPKTNTNTMESTPVYSPEQAAIWSRKGKTAHEQGDIEGAIQAWQQAVELNPADSVTVNNLALVLKGQHRFHEAADLLEKGVKASPSTSELHYNLAVISELYLLDLEKALMHYKRYQSLAIDEDKSVTGWIADLERRLE
ncbi:tetratricopeptide repeat protein [Marinobacter sp.]|uniref:tetratricopeptide repeat protein n=1 Tax=Marinobacter sp. TaxID=50741 RepID=UPI003567E36F